LYPQITEKLKHYRKTSNQTMEPTATSFDWQFFLKWVFATTLGWLLGLALSQVLVAEAAIGFFIGLLQWVVLRPQIHHAGQWIVTSAIGWAAGWVLVLTFFPPQIDVLAGVVLGTAIGLAQWFIMRQWFHMAGWWIIISALGWSIGLTGIMGYSLVGTIAGAVTGIQIELLFRSPRLKK
jgi:hypothetical protein